MNRKYTAGGYQRLADEIRARVPGISLTTDILTGFPGETEEDFQKTLELIERCGFDSVFAYKYSAREGTASFNISETVSEEEKASGIRWSRGLPTGYQRQSMQGF